MKTKIEKRYIDETFGFPVEVIDAPMRLIPQRLRRQRGNRRWRPIQNAYGQRPEALSARRNISRCRTRVRQHRQVALLASDSEQFGCAIDDKPPRRLMIWAVCTHQERHTHTIHQSRQDARRICR